MSPLPLKRSSSEGDLFYSRKRAKHQEDDEDPGILGSVSSFMNLPPVRCSAIDGNSSSGKNKCKHQDDEYPILQIPTFICVENKNGQRVFEPLHPLPERPKIDPKVYLDYAWGLLKPAIRIIFLDEEYSFSCAAIFNAVGKAWSVESGEALFKLIQEECGTYISASILSLEGHCSDDLYVFLPLMEKCWLDFLRKMRFICSFAGSDGRRVGRRTLWELSTELLFPKHLRLASQVHEKVLSSILQLIKDQRSGKTVDTSLLENIMEMFKGEYFSKTRFFEETFLKCASEFYAAEAVQTLGQSDIPQYLKHVERRLSEEEEKCKCLYFFILFEEPLIEVVLKEFLVVHVSAILEKGLDKLMVESCGDDLERLYDLFSRANLLGHMNDAISSYILKTGRKILAEGSSLEEFKACVDKIWVSYFFEDESVEKIVEKCFRDLGLPWKDRFASAWL